MMTSYLCDSASCERETELLHEVGSGVFCSECSERRIRFAFDPAEEREQQAADKAAALLAAPGSPSPGPWVARVQRPAAALTDQEWQEWHETYEIRDSRGGLIATTPPCYSLHSHAASALLMAAAPEMYEALHHAKEALEISEVYFEMKGQCGEGPLLKVRAALARAEGGER